MKLLRSLTLALLLAPLGAVASEGGYPLDKAPDVSGDQAALQRGAKTFINYCLNCHGASYMRYNRLKEIGLTEDQIKDNLLFTADKVGEQMKIAMNSADGKAWFGATPPDLTLIARSRASELGSGSDWLYTYLRTFYRDEGRPTGWNNLVFENVGMPHVLWELQGQQTIKVTKDKGADGHEVEHKHLQLAVPGKMTAQEYDGTVADLVGFLRFMGEPVEGTRKAVGLGVLLVLGILFLLAYPLKKAFWKDIH